MYNQILPNLFLGDLQDALDFDKAYPNGMIIVVLEQRPPNEPFRSIHYPILSSSSHVHSKQLDRLNKIIDSIISSNIPLLVHCAAGIERSPLVIVYYLVKTKGLTLEDAYTFVKKIRPQISDRSNWLKID